MSKELPSTVLGRPSDTSRSPGVAPVHAKRFAIDSPQWWAACDLAYKQAVRKWAEELLADKRMRDREARQCPTSQ